MMIHQRTLRLTGERYYYNSGMEYVIVSLLQSSPHTAFDLVESVKRTANHPEWRWLEPVHILVRVDRLVREGVVCYE